MRRTLAAILLCAACSAQTWIQHGAHPSFSIDGPTLSTSGRGQVGNWIHTVREYEDFRLRFDYKLAQWAEAAVLLRAPLTDRPQHAGLAIVLAHDFHKHTSPYVTGALMGVRPPLAWQGEKWGAWQKVEIELKGDRLRASIDGAPVQDLDLSALPETRHRLRRGVIGFPDMGYAYSVRNVEIEDLGSPTKFIDLIPPDGWTLTNGGTWRVHGDTIEAMNGHGIYYAPGNYRDFELTAVVRSHDRVNGGIFLRGRPEEKQRGFEIQIYSPVDAVYPTGSIYNIERARISADYEERWFLMQIRVEGSRCRVWLDGELVAETSSLPDSLSKPGRIGLQIHSDDARIEFRHLRLQDWGQ